MQNSATNVSSNAVNKLELDSVPNFKGTPIYDLDLASMEDKPWRKPGADITDYFNYGFNEGLFNICFFFNFIIFLKFFLLIIHYFFRNMESIL